MNINPTQPAATSPVASTQTSTTADKPARPSIGARIDSFGSDLERGVKDAEHGIANLFHRRRRTGTGSPKPVSPTGAVTPPAQALSPVTEVESLGIGSKPPALDTTAALPAPVLVPAQAPRIAASLTTIAQELEKLIAANGGALKLAEEGLEIIAGALNNPAAEANVVLADLGKIITAILQDTFKQTAHVAKSEPEVV